MTSCFMRHPVLKKYVNILQECKSCVKPYFYISFSWITKKLYENHHNVEKEDDF